MLLKVLLSILILSMAGCFTRDKDRTESRIYMKATINGKEWKTTEVHVTRGPAPDNAPQKLVGTDDGTISLILPDIREASFPMRSNGAGRINPAMLTSFTIESRESGFLVKWSTAGESGTEKFILERSVDGTNFTAIDSVQAAGTAHDYEYTYSADYDLLSFLTLRLKMVDTDGREAYSSVMRTTVTFLGAYGVTHPQSRRGYDGELRIITVDEANGLIKGTFHFKTKTSSGQVITISNGEFQVEK
jgi:hypothetical protein